MCFDVSNEIGQKYLAANALTDHGCSKFQLWFFFLPHAISKRKWKIRYPVILPYRYAKHNTYKAVSIQIIGTIMCGMVKEFWNILKPSSGLCYHGIIHTKKYRLCCQWIRYHSQSNFSCDIHKVGIINFCIGTCVVKGIEGFCGNPRQKVLI